MKFNKLTWLLIFALMSTIANYGQEKSSHEHENETEDFHHHSIGFLISHSYISLGQTDGDRDWLIAPSLALNYNYLFNEKWGLGWHNDLIIEEFIVEDVRENSAELERSFPFSTMLVGLYKPSEHWSLLIGGGVEIEENESFGLIRFGAEYGIEISGPKLEVLFAVNYDLLIDAYDSVNFGIGIAKLF